jgi:hypothetical protein
LFNANTLEISPRPPSIVLFSSNDAFCFAKDLRIASSSNGLMVCMLITSAEIPFASNASAAKRFHTVSSSYDCYVSPFAKHYCFTNDERLVSGREVSYYRRQKNGP